MHFTGRLQSRGHRGLPLRTSRNCRGRIYIEDGLDLYGDDYKCPHCDRPIYPGKKKRYEEWRVRLLPNGIKAFVESALKEAGLTWKEKAPGVFRVDVGEEEVWLFIVDFGESCQHMTREWAVANKNKALWLVVHPRGKAERFLREDWIPVVSLSELLTGSASLNSLLQARAACNPVTNLGNPSLPIYTKGRRHHGVSHLHDPLETPSTGDDRIITFGRVPTTICPGSY